VSRKCPQARLALSTTKVTAFHLQLAKYIYVTLIHRHMAVTTGLFVRTAQIVQRKTIIVPLVKINITDDTLKYSCIFLYPHLFICHILNNVLLLASLYSCIAIYTFLPYRFLILPFETTPFVFLPFPTVWLYQCYIVENSFLIKNLFVNRDEHRIAIIKMI